MPTVANASLLDSKSVVWFLRSIGDMYPLECTSSRPFRVQNDYPTGVPSYLDSVKDMPGFETARCRLVFKLRFQSPQPANLEEQSLPGLPVTTTRQNTAPELVKI